MFRASITIFLAVFMLASAVGADFLLIPETTNDTIGMYDPFDGTYLGDFSDGGGVLIKAINAQLGPDGYIYVSDQNIGAVFRFNLDGTYFDTFISGQYNVRGFDFRDGHLFFG